MSYYVKHLYGFLTGLEANNNREWFRAHKGEYDELRALWIEDVRRMIAAMSEWDISLQHIDPKRAALRIYRDTRFSFDKTPYKTYFAVGLSPLPAGYYLQMSPNIEKYQGLYAGLWCPERDLLRKMRHAIVDNIEEWEEIVSTPALQKHFHIIASSELKTAPKGWPKDHPNIKWLRLNDYGLEDTVSPEFFLDPDWPLKASELFRLTKPFVDFLNYSACE